MRKMSLIKQRSWGELRLAKMASLGEPSVNDITQKNIYSSVDAGRVDNVKICKERGDMIVASERAWRKVYLVKMLVNLHSGAWIKGVEIGSFPMPVVLKTPFARCAVLRQVGRSDDGYTASPDRASKTCKRKISHSGLSLIVVTIIAFRV